MLPLALPILLTIGLPLPVGESRFEAAAAWKFASLRDAVEPKLGPDNEYSTLRIVLDPQDRLWPERDKRVGTLYEPHPWRDGFVYFVYIDAEFEEDVNSRFDPVAIEQSTWPNHSLLTTPESRDAKSMPKPAAAATVRAEPSGEIDANLIRDVAWYGWWIFSTVVEPILDFGEPIVVRQRPYVPRPVASLRQSDEMTTWVTLIRRYEIRWNFFSPAPGETIGDRHLDPKESRRLEQFMKSPWDDDAVFKSTWMMHPLLMRYQTYHPPGRSAFQYESWRVEFLNSLVW